LYPFQPRPHDTGRGFIHILRSQTPFCANAHIRIFAKSDQIRQANAEAMARWLAEGD
jgi:hypothetical protein